MRKTYEELTKGIEQICSKYNFDEIKKANKEVKRIFVNELDSMFKTENELETIMYYDLIDDEGDCVRIGYDFWNGRLVV